MTDTLTPPAAASEDPESRFAERTRAAAAIAAEHADDVDISARFPAEAIESLRASGLLAAAVPVEFGGESATFAELSEIATALAEGCSATGMIFVMHQIQVLCLTRHGLDSATITGFLRAISANGWLLASATTEIGIGGNTRTSGCSVDEQPDGSVVLAKTAPVISYGAYADMVLVTARRTPDSVPSDQVLVACPANVTTLTPTSEWNTLGFRGTCSPGFELVATVDASHVLPAEFATISAETMLPVSHALWASVWLGIARAATDKASRVVQLAARKNIGTLPPAATRLAELLADLGAFESVTADAVRTFEERADRRELLTTIPSAIAFNSLKVNASEAVIDIVGKAMLIAGISGYRQGTDVSLGRLLRDSYGTAVMVNNDRILGNNAQLSLMQRRKGNR